MSDLRERIRAAMNLPLGFSSVEARELLPLLLAELERLEQKSALDDEEIRILMQAPQKPEDQR